MIRRPTLVVAMTKLVLLTFPSGPNDRFKLLSWPKLYNGWFRKLYPENLNCSRRDSEKLKFLNSDRSLLKNAGPNISGSTIGPFLPGEGSAKQAALMNWWECRPCVGLHV